MKKIDPAIIAEWDRLANEIYKDWKAIEDIKRKRKVIDDWLTYEIDMLEEDLFVVASNEHEDTVELVEKDIVDISIVVEFLKDLKSLNHGS